MSNLFIKQSFIGQKFKPHFHNNYSIGLILDGRHKLNINHTKELILPSELKIINPNELHYVEENSQWSYINLLLETRYVYTIASQIYGNIDKNIKFKTKINDKNINFKFLKLYNAQNNSMEYEELLISFVEIVLKKHSIINKQYQNNYNNNITKAIEFLNSCFLEDISLDAIAKVIGISKYHTIKLFKQKTDLTPHQYILRLRIEHGIMLIKKGLSLAQVASSCGFSDQSHFIKEFKKIYGITPSKLLRPLTIL